MGREKVSYRDNLAILHERFPDKEMLNAKDVQTVYGCSLSTVYKKILGNLHRISKPDLARLMSK